MALQFSFICFLSVAERYYKDRKNMTLKAKKKEKLISELMRFTKEIKAHGRYLNSYLLPQQIIEAES